MKNNEMRWEMKIFKRSKTGENIRREGGEMVVIKNLREEGSGMKK